MTQELEKAIEKGIQKGFEVRESQKSAFRVDPERHFKHHDFLDGAIEFFDDSRQIIWKVVLTSAIVGILSIFGIGVVAFIYAKSQGIM